MLHLSRFKFLIFIFFELSACSTSPQLNHPPMLAILAKIHQNGFIRVGTTGDYRPFSYLNSDGIYSGMDIALAQNLADSLKVKLVLVKTPWPNLSADVTADRFDIAMGGISKTPEREKIGFLSDGYWASGKTAIARCQETKKYLSLAQIDRPQVTVIVNPGGSNEKFLKANLSRAKILNYPDNNTIFDQIELKKADVMITDSSEVDLMTRLHRQLCAVTPGKTFDHSEFVYFMPVDLGWKEYVNGWLKRLMQKHVIEQAYEKAIHPNQT
jgi:cyclohexadienyl dehydratase